MGTLRDSKGFELYSGSWLGGKYHGEGVESVAQHEVYTGSFREGRRWVHGTSRDDKAGHVYEGEWAHGLRHGWGKLTSSRAGAVMEGEWVQSKLEGYVIIHYDRGAVYEGQNRLALPIGAGKYTFPADDSLSRRELEGTFKSGSAVGVATLRFTDGGEYTGEVNSERMRHGRGRMRYADGAVYDGKWHEHKRHGSGTLTAADGTVTDGQWHNNAPDDGSRASGANTSEFDASEFDADAL